MYDYGNGEYYPLVEKYHIAIVVIGFEPIDLLQGILMTVRQLESGEARVENQYTRIVKSAGNIQAKRSIFEVFEISDRMWRGIDVIPMSGYEVKEKYAGFDAKRKFDIPIGEVKENEECLAGDIMKGIKKPFKCPNFGNKCKPLTPLGAPMVSSEGECAAYYHYTTLAKNE